MVLPTGGDMPQKTFLVYQLRSCSHRFPFKSLRYRASGARCGPARGDATAAISQVSQVRRSAPDSHDQQLVEREATNKLTGAAKQVRSPVRFPDLIRKFVRKEAAEIAIEEAAPINASAGQAVQEVSLGDSGADNRVRSVDLSVVMDPSDPLHRVPPNFLREVSVELSTMREVKIALLTRSDDDGWTIPAPIVADDDGVIEPRLFTSDSSGQMPRLRRLAAFAATYNDDSVSIVVVECAQPWWKLYGPAVDNEAHQRLLQIGAMDFATGQSS